MSSIIYLWKCTLVNNIKKVMTSPIKIILYLVFLSIMLVMLISMIVFDSPLEIEFQSELIYGMIFFTGEIYFFKGIINGLNSKNKIFTESDVNLLFLSPIRPKTILISAIVKNMGYNSLMGVYLLFQLNGIKSFNMTAPESLFLIFFIAVMIISSRIFSAAAYLFTDGDDRKKDTIKLFIAIIIAFQIVFYIMFCIGAGGALEGLVAILNLRVMDFLPFFGWIKGACAAFFSGRMGESIMFSAAALIAVITAIIYIIYSKGDYYDRVVSANDYNLIDSEDERSVVNKTNKRSYGARAILFRQVKEMYRNRSGGNLLSPALMIAIGIMVPVLSSGNMLITMAVALYVTFINNASGMWAQDLRKIYIYIIPESPFKKLIYATIPDVIKMALDGILVVLTASVVSRIEVHMSIAYILTFISFCCIFAASNIIAQRLFGTISNKLVIALLYFLIMAALMTPGLLFAGLINLYLSYSHYWVSCVACIGCNLFVSMWVYYFCRDLLHNMEGI